MQKYFHKGYLVEKGYLVFRKIKKEYNIFCFRIFRLCEAQYQIYIIKNKTEVLE